MSSPHQGLWSTLAMFIPLLAVPFLAAIGIPQFTPTAASSEDEPPELGELQRVEIGVGESLHHRADDLFAPFAQEGSRHGEREAPPSSPEGKWDDPFHGWGGQQSRRASDSRPSATLDDPRAQPPAPRGINERFSDDAPLADQSRSSANTGRRLRANDSGGSQSAPAAPAHEWLSLDQESPFATRERQPRPAPPENAGSRSDPRSDRSFAAAPADGSPFAPGAAPREQKPSGDERPLTWQDARRQLSELGIRDFQLNPGQGEGQFHFGCTFTPPESPRVVHRFEAEATEPLAAVEKVIRQVEAWRGRP